MTTNHDDAFEDDLEGFAEEADGAPAGEDALGDEDWDSYDEPDEGGATPGGPAAAPSKKKSSLFNVILIGVILLGGGAFMVMHGGKKAPPPPPQQQPQPVKAPPEAGFLNNPGALAALQKNIARRAAPPEHLAPTPAANPVAPPQTLSARNPKEVRNVPVPPMPNMVAPAQPSLPTEAQKMAPMPVKAAQQTLASPQNPPTPEAPHMPNAQDVMLKGAPQPQQAVAPQKPQPENLQTETIAAQAKAAEATQGKIDTLQASIEKLQGTIKTLEEKSRKDDSTIESLQKKIHGLMVAQTKPARMEKTAHAPKLAEMALRHRAASKPEILGASENAKPEDGNKDGNGGWVLKGARPGHALIARIGADETRNIQVGDMVPGIGRVMAVSYADGQWSVAGTKGKITQ